MINKVTREKLVVQKVKDYTGFLGLKKGGYQPFLNKKFHKKKLT